MEAYVLPDLISFKLLLEQRTRGMLHDLRLEWLQNTRKSTLLLILSFLDPKAGSLMLLVNPLHESNVFLSSVFED
jgi:hypothetical protein